LITNHKEWIIDLDQRIKSRLTPDMLEFRAYDSREIEGILKERLKYAFAPDVWDDEALKMAVKKSASAKDVRLGLHILKEAGHYAEDASSKKILSEYVKEAIEKVDSFSVRKTDELDEDSRTILSIIKSNRNKKIGDIFRIYQDQGGKGVYKSFQRKIKKLQDGKYINVKRVTGAEGNTSLIDLAGSQNKLTEF